MNMLQALERSARQNRLALFECRSFSAALRLALELRPIADCLITSAVGTLYVGATKKLGVS